MPSFELSGYHFPTSRQINACPSSMFFIFLSTQCLRSYWLTESTFPCLSAPILSAEQWLMQANLISAANTIGPSFDVTNVLLFLKASAVISKAGFTASLNIKRSLFLFISTISTRSIIQWGQTVFSSVFLCDNRIFKFCTPNVLSTFSSLAPSKNLLSFYFDMPSYRGLQFLGLLL